MRFCLLLLFFVHYITNHLIAGKAFNEEKIIFLDEYENLMAKSSRELKEQTTNVNIEKRLDRTLIPINEPLCQNNGMTYCTEVENYPSAEIESILMRTDINKYAALFGEDKIPEKISQRTNGEDKIIDLCEYEEDIYYPKVAMTDHKDWLYVINTDAYKQGVRIEYCSFSNSNSRRSTDYFPKSKNAECLIIKDHLPNSYLSECTQKYATRVLVALNKENNSIVRELFSFPSCCQCILKRV